MAGKKTVISPVHRISEDLDRRWRKMCFFTRKTSTYHKAKAMELYLKKMKEDEK